MKSSPSSPPAPRPSPAPERDGAVTAAPVLASARLDAGVLSLELANSIDAIEAGRRELALFSAHHHLAPRIVNRLEVIFEEVISNIVRHGFAPGADAAIHVHATAAPDAITLRFEDDGTPFNPLEVAPPAPLRSLAEARLGGLGIPLLRRYTTSMAYEAPEPRAVGFSPRNRLTVTVATGASPSVNHEEKEPPAAGSH